MVRGVSDGFMEAFQPFLTVYASDPELQGEPGRHQQQGRRRLHAAADGRHPRRRHCPIRPSRPTDPAIFDDASSTRWPASLCDRASAAGFDSLDTITSVLQNPQTAVLPDDPRYRMFQAMKPINIDAGDAGERRLRRARRASTASSPPASRGG